MVAASKALNDVGAYRKPDGGTGSVGPQFSVDDKHTSLGRLSWSRVGNPVRAWFPIVGGQPNNPTSNQIIINGVGVKAPMLPLGFRLRGGCKVVVARLASTVLAMGSSHRKAAHSRHTL